MKMLIVFEKSPRLRFIGHLDLMRAMQRALRRSDLPIKYSQGFNPHILLTFASPLSVGVAGRREVMDVPVESGVTAESFKERFSRALPPDLPCLEVRQVEDSHPAPMALLRAARYQAVFDGDISALADKIPDYLARKEIPAIRHSKSGDKPCDVRPMIHALEAIDGSTLDMTLDLCESSTCKPDLLLSSLAEFAGAELPRCLLTRTQLLGQGKAGLAPLETL